MACNCKNRLESIRCDEDHLSVPAPDSVSRSVLLISGAHFFSPSSDFGRTRMLRPSWLRHSQSPGSEDEMDHPRDPVLEVMHALAEVIGQRDRNGDDHGRDKDEEGPHRR